MDIRSFFSPGAKSKPSSNSRESKAALSEVKKIKREKPSRKKKRQNRASDSDSDEEPLPQKLRKTKTKTAFIDESDDDNDDVVVIEVKKERSPGKPEEGKDAKSKELKDVKPALKPTTAIDFFGSTPVTQKTKPSILNKGKPNNDVKRAVKEETKGKKRSKSRKRSRDKLMTTDDDEIVEIMEDDDFEKSVAEMQSIPDEEENDTKSTPKKENGQRLFIDESPLPSKKKDAKEPSEMKKSSLERKKKKSKQIATAEGDSELGKNEDGNTVRKSTNKDGKKGKEEMKEKKKEQEMKSAAAPKELSSPVVEKKKSYFAYKAREGPKNLGAKEIPQGAENCMEGLSFVITGILESVEREQAVDLVKRHGGKVVSAVSKKTNYLVVGRDPGESKLQKASSFGTKQLDEDGLFELVRQLPAKVSKYDQPQASEKKTHQKSLSTVMTSESKYFKNEGKSEITMKYSEGKQTRMEGSRNAGQDRKASQKSKTTERIPLSGKEKSGQSNPGKPAEALLWVDKHKPTSMRNIVGQHGEKSNAKKLLNWLVNWDRNHSGGSKPKGKGGFFAAKEDGSIFKCALLSGPPGVGKTTTATIICKEAEYSFMELNASDTRSKNTLKRYISEVLSNKTVDNVLLGEQKTATGKHALVMDEVDGMAGNEDRGGVQELISLIKSTKIPIICMCNDRNHPKIRSLANYCFDLRFYKPRVDAIKGFAMSVAFKEGLKIPSPVMEQIIVGANQDIRQVLHNLQMWSSTKSSLTYDEAKEEASKSQKNIKIGPFDIVKKLFSASESQNMRIDEKLGLFFNDYSFIPLFVQENYLLANPRESRGNQRKTLELMSSAADAISDSNLVEKRIRGSQAWSLLPLQGFFSCVAAPDMMRGGLTQRINFPQWLGKNSSQGKHDRILQELKTHMRLSCLAGKADLNMDYAWLMRQKLVAPLVNPGDDVNGSARQVIDLMNSYNLTREDWESFVEIGKWDAQRDITASIPSKVKAAFTRAYNKDIHLTPFATGTAAKKKRVDVSMDDELKEESPSGDEDDENEDDDYITKDSMIKISKKKAGEVNEGSSKRGKGKSAPKNPGKGRAKK